MTERYASGKIYKLVSNMTDKIYIGSCCVPLRQRLFNHKYQFNHWKDGRRKTVSSSSILFELGGDVQIILIEDFATDSKDKLLARERFYIESTPCVNIYRPIVFEFERAEFAKQYTEANKEHIRATSKAYRSIPENRERLNATRKQYHLLNKEKDNATNKQYHLDNREVILQKQREHYNANKEHIRATRKAYSSIPENRERINATTKQYHLDNREVILQKMKEHYNANKEHIRATRKQYYLDNREVIRQKKKERYNANKELKILSI